MAETLPTAPSETRRLTEREVAEWVVNTCVTFGASVHTAYKVAGLFIEGIARPDQEHVP